MEKIGMGDFGGRNMGRTWDGPGTDMGRRGTRPNIFAKPMCRINICKKSQINKQKHTIMKKHQQTCVFTLQANIQSESQLHNAKQTNHAASQQQCEK